MDIFLKSFAFLLLKIFYVSGAKGKFQDIVVGDRQLLDTIDTWGNIFEVTANFTMMSDGITSRWTSLLEFTATDDDSLSFGDRLLWLFTRDHQKIMVITHIGDEVNKQFTSPKLEQDVHHKLEIKQSMVDDELVFEAKVDGKSFAKVTNPRPLKFSNVKLYAQNLHVPASAVFHKLQYKNKVEGEVEDANESSDKQCLFGWKYLEKTDKCYKGFRHDVRMDKATAEKFCQTVTNDEGSIAQVPNEETNNHLVDIFSSHDPKPLWLAPVSSDENPEKYTVAGKEISYSNWYPKEPNNPAEKCVMFRPDGKWVDVFCTTKRDVACEHDSLLDADGNRKPAKKGRNPLASPGSYEEMNPSIFDSKLFQSSKDDFYWLIIKLRKDYFKKRLIEAARK